MRSLQAAPPKSLAALQRDGADVVLRCFLPGCTECARFYTEEGPAFERRHKWTQVVPWDCSSKRHRRIAEQAGVGDVPAYVVVKTGEVVRP